MPHANFIASLDGTQRVLVVPKAIANPYDCRLFQELATQAEALNRDVLFAFLFKNREAKTHSLQRSWHRFPVSTTDRSAARFAW